MADFFSRREGFNLPQGEQINELNQRTRNKLEHILEVVHQCYSYNSSWEEITNDFFRIIGELPTELHQDWSALHIGDGGFRYLVEKYVGQARWYIVFDLLEIIYGRLHMRAREHAEPFEQAINNVFSEEIVQWWMVNGKFERIIGQVEVIRKAESSLADKEFTKAHDHLLKAWEAFHKQPNPDLNGCMRDIWDAVEIVSKHCTGLDGGTFGDALPKLIEMGMVLKDWKHTFDKFYGIASNWVRHPRSEPLQCKIEDAEAFLVISSQMIIYIITGYSWQKK